MKTAVMPCPPSKAVPEKANARFVEMLPELMSRCERMARRYPKKQRRDAADDALTACFLNYAQAARKKKELSASDLGYYAALHLRHRSLSTQRGYPSRRRDRFVSLDSVPPGNLATQTGRALSTSERDDPAERARVRLDWSAFADVQDRRTRRILHGLAMGETKGRIAAKLNVSRCRISQLLDGLGKEIVAFFGPFPNARRGACAS